MHLQYLGRDYPCRNAMELTIRQWVEISDVTSRLGHPINSGIASDMFTAIDAIKHPDPVEQSRLRGSCEYAQWTVALNLYAGLRLGGLEVDGRPVDFDWILDHGHIVAWHLDPGDPGYGGKDVVPDPTSRPAKSPAKARKSSAANASRRATAKATQSAKSTASRSKKASTTGS